MQNLEYEQGVSVDQRGKWATLPGVLPGTLAPMPSITSGSRACARDLECLEPAVSLVSLVLLEVSGAHCRNAQMAWVPIPVRLGKLLD